MNISRALAVIALAITTILSFSAQASEEAFCSDGLRMVDLGAKGSLTARGFVATLQSAKDQMTCRPDGILTGPGIWQSWFDSKIYTCKSKNNLVRAYLTRTGVVTTLQITNAFGFLIFNGPCQVKR